MPSAPKFDLKLWRAVLEHLGFTPQQAKKGTEAYDVAMAEYKQHAESGGGVGSSRPAKVAPAPPPPTPRGMPVDVSAQILEITGRIMRDAESLRHAMQDKKTGKAPRARGYRLDDIREEEGGAIATTGKKAKRPLSAWQQFVKKGMRGVKKEDLQSRMKEIAAEWQAMKG